MFHTRREGDECRYGFNFHPWSERHVSIGFVLRLPHWRLRLRYSTRYREFRYGCERCLPIEQEKQLFNDWQRRA